MIYIKAGQYGKDICMKKFLYTIAPATFFICAGILSVVALYPQTSYAATSITSWADLDAMRSGLSGSYVLTTDLDSNSAGYATYAGSAANAGAGWSPVGDNSTPFTGTFDGANYSIKDIYISRAATSYVGLFGKISGATVRNVRMTNAYVSGNSQVGGLTGAGTTGYTISGVYY